MLKSSGSKQITDKTSENQHGTKICVWYLWALVFLINLKSTFSFLVGKWHYRNDVKQPSLSRAWPLFTCLLDKVHRGRGQRQEGCLWRAGAAVALLRRLVTRSRSARLTVYPSDEPTAQRIGRWASIEETCWTDRSDTPLYSHLSYTHFTARTVAENIRLIGRRI